MTLSYNRLNLGCGTDIRDGWVNVDVEPSVDPDIVHDLDDHPWPFADASIQHIEARHVLEHLEDVPGALQEIARILKPGGTLKWVYPIGHTRFEDITHQHFWNENSGQQAVGARKHDHEVVDDLQFTGQEIEWHISQSEPLVALYTRYRLWLRGPGPWLSGIPGLYGETEVLLTHDG